MRDEVFPFFPSNYFALTIQQSLCCIVASLIEIDRCQTCLDQQQISFLDIRHVTELTEYCSTQVTNAFDSPSVIRFTKDAKDSSNPFSSPAVRVNGGGTTSKL